jgi:integrase/recombinase XerC
MNLSINNTQDNIEQVFNGLDVTESTRADYKARIGMFLTFVGESGFNRNSFLNYKRCLAQKTDFTVSTKNKYLASARVFVKELNRQGMLPADITQNIKGFTQSKKHKKDGLSESDMSLLVENIQGLSDTPKNNRLKAILGLLALQGLRQVEIIRLDVSDIDLVAKVAFVLGKGRDDKEPVDLHPETVRLIKDYLASNKIKSGALFQSQSNNSKNKRLTTRGLRQMIKKVLTNLGINKSTHGFRHYFTTKMIKSYKGDLLEVAGYTRHKSLEMLQVYFDKVKREADLPRYYGAFKGVSF